MNYIKKVCYEMKHQRIMVWVSVCGTAIAVFLVMAFFLTDRIRNCSVAPATQRDRIVTGSYLSAEYDGNSLVLSSGLSRELALRLYSGLDGVEKMSLVKSWEPLVDVGVKGGKYLSLQPRYVDDVFWKIYDFSFIDGRSFDKAEVDADAKVAVVTVSTARRLFKDSDVVGREISVGHDRFRIIGVTEDVSPVLRELFGNLYVPFNGRNSDYSSYEGLTNVRLLLKPGVNPESVKKQVEKRVKAISAADEGKEEYRLVYAGQPYTNEETLYRTPQDFIMDRGDFHSTKMWMYYGVFLIVPAITLGSMTRSRLRHRVSEIGVRRAFGASRKSIMAQLIGENFVITLLGGAIGMVLCLLFMWLLSPYFITMIDYSYMSALEGIYAGPTFSMLFDLRNFVVALVLCFVLNLLCSFFPALRASKVEPAQAIANSKI